MKIKLFCLLLTISVLFLSIVSCAPATKTAAFATTAEVTALQTSINAMNSRLIAAETKLTTLTPADLTSAKSDLTELTTSVGTIKTQVDLLQTKVNTLDLTTINTKLTELSTKIIALDTRLDTLETPITTMPTPTGQVMVTLDQTTPFSSSTAQNQQPFRVLIHNGTSTWQYVTYNVSFGLISGGSANVTVETLTANATNFIAIPGPSQTAATQIIFFYPTATPKILVAAGQTLPILNVVDIRTTLPYYWQASLTFTASATP